MGGTPIRAALMQYFDNHPGVVVYLSELMEALGEDKKRIQSGIANLKRESDYPLEVKVTGNAWVYRPSVTNVVSKRMFEELAITKDGRILIQDQNGTVYVATEL